MFHLPKSLQAPLLEPGDPQESEASGGTKTGNTMTWTNTGGNTNVLSNFYVTGPLGTTPGMEITDAAIDIWDTININTAVNLGSGDTVEINGYQINLTETSSINSQWVTLQSVASLNFAQTGLTYTGNLNINAAPSTGQPFANNQYISGPNWSNYGYAAGDAVTLTYMPSSGTTTTTANLTIVDIIENNMYFTNSTTLPTGSQTNATITPSTTFTPQIQGTTLTLTVTGHF